MQVKITSNVNFIFIKVKTVFMRINITMVHGSTALVGQGLLIVEV